MAAEADVGCSRSRMSRRATPAASCATRRAPCSPKTIVPRDFDRVDIPFPERGGPVHVKASDKPPEPEAECEPAVP